MATDMDIDMDLDMEPLPEEQMFEVRHIHSRTTHIKLTFFSGG